ncbi:MAG: SGNH/GDSL hydrolase family protein [Actinomycetota bacterium]
MGRKTWSMLAAMAFVLTGCAGVQSPSPQSRMNAPATPLTTPSSSPAPVPHVVMIGDSIMRGYGLDTTDEAWPQLLATDEGWDLDNIACDGAGFLAWGNWSECGGTYDAIVTDAIQLDPTTVIIEGSSNDFGQDDGDLATTTTQLLAELRTGLPDAQIIGLSTIWGDTAPPEQLAAVNSQVRSAVRAAGGVYVTIGQPLSGHPEWMQDDDIHPTADGQQAIMRAVKAAFANHAVPVR